jgi:hypothetical protein
LRLRRRVANVSSMYGTPYSESLMCQCPRCHQPTWHTRSIREVNHTFHLLFTVLFCGLWLPIWILYAAMGPNCSAWQCGRCGQQT